MSFIGANFGLPHSGQSGIVSTGTGLATAYVLVEEVTIFSSVPSGTGAVLPSSYAPGVMLTVGSRDATNSLLLYPALGDQIENTGVNVAISVPPGANVTLISFDPPLSKSPRTWWQVASYNQGAYLPLSGGTIAGPLTITGTLTGNGTIVLSPASKNVTISPTGTGSVVIAPATAGTLDNVALGQSTPLAATVTTFTATGVVTLSPASHSVTLSPTGTGNVVIAPATAGTLDNLVIGGATPLAATFTALTATSSVALSPTNKNVVISPTGTGVVTINPSTAGTLDNVKIGSGTPLAATFTSLTATAAVALSPANKNVVLSPTGTGLVTINPATAGALDNVVIGASTPLAGHFTTLSATTNSASSQKAVAAPTAPASTTAFTMQGLAGSITPATTGNVILTINGVAESNTNTSGDGIQFQISYGTGAAPTNAAALTGTQAGSVLVYVNASAVTAGNVAVPFSLTAVVTGLTPATAYWIDLAAKSVATISSGKLANINISAIEFR